MDDIIESLTNRINERSGKIPEITWISPFDLKRGPIPRVVPNLRGYTRFASGEIVFGERLKALNSNDSGWIDDWCNNPYSLADACIVFEDLLKAQPDSPLLKGIKGVVKTSDGPYIAVDAKAVLEATKGNMKYFEITQPGTVYYSSDEGIELSSPVWNVVLFRYVNSSYIALTADQFHSIDAKALKRSDFIHGSAMKKGNIVKNEQVVHPVYEALYPTGLVVSLVPKIFEFNKEEYKRKSNMGIFLPPEPEYGAEMRAFYVCKLKDGSNLRGDNNIGSKENLIVGLRPKIMVDLKKVLQDL